MHPCCLGSLSRFRYFRAVFRSLMRSVKFTHVQTLCKARSYPRVLTDLRLSIAYCTQQWISPISLKADYNKLGGTTVCIVVMSRRTPTQDGLVSALCLPTFRHLLIVNKSSSSSSSDYLISINRQKLSRYPIFGGIERFHKLIALSSALESECSRFVVERCDFERSRARIAVA